MSRNLNFCDAIYVPKNAVADGTESSNLLVRKAAVPSFEAVQRFRRPLVDKDSVSKGIQDSENPSHVF